VAAWLNRLIALPVDRRCRATSVSSDGESPGGNALANRGPAVRDHRRADLADIEKQTVDMVPELRHTGKSSPTFLPSRIPNLLAPGCHRDCGGHETTSRPQPREIPVASSTLSTTPEATGEDLCLLSRAQTFPTGGKIRGRRHQKARMQPARAIIVQARHTFRAGAPTGV